jgi:lipopolysaccharide export system permease protein
MIFYRYFLKTFIRPFLYSFLVITTLFFMQLAASILPQVMYCGVAFLVICELMLVRMAAIIVLSMPMAFLVAILTVFGQFSARNEIVALKASGKSILDFLPPFLSFGALVGVLLFFFTDQILPEANHHAATLFRDIIRKRPAAMIEEGVLLEDFPGYALWVDSVDHSSGNIYDIRIFEREQGQINSLTVADSGTVFLTEDEKFVELSLFSGGVFSKGPDDNFYNMHFSRHRVYIENIESNFARSDGGSRGGREKSTAQLVEGVSEMEEDISEYTASHREEIDGYIEFIRTYYDTGYVSDEVVFSSLRDFSDSLKSSDNRIYPHRSLTMERSVSAMRAGRIERRQRDIDSYMVEYHKKFALGAAVLVFALLGPPLGIITKSGSAVIGAVYSFIFFVIYYALLIAGEYFGDEGIVSPAAAMWSGNILISCFSLYLIIILLRGETLILRGILQNRILIPLRSAAYYLLRGEQRFAKKITESILYAAGYLFALPSWIFKKIFKIIPAYILVLFISMFAVIFLGLMGLTVVIDYITDMNRLEGALFGELLKYYLNFLAGFVAILFPISGLLAAMITMGSLQGTREIDAIRAAGRSMVSVTFPLVLCGVFLSLLSFFITDFAFPERDAETSRLLSVFSARRRGEELPSQTRKYNHDFFFFDTRNTMYHFRHLQTVPPRGDDVTIFNFSSGTAPQKISFLEKVEYINEEWMAYNADIWHVNPQGHLTYEQKDTSALRSLEEGPEKMIETVHGSSNASIAELQRVIEQYMQQGKDPAKYEARLYFRFFLPWMNLVVIFLGIAVSVKTGGGNRAVHFGKGVALTLLYWVLVQVLLMMGENGVVHPLIAAGGGNLFFLVFGFYMYWSVSK